MGLISKFRNKDQETEATPNPFELPVADDNVRDIVEETVIADGDTVADIVVEENNHGFFVPIILSRNMASVLS